MFTPALHPVGSLRLSSTTHCPWAAKGTWEFGSRRNGQKFRLAFCCCCCRYTFFLKTSFPGASNVTKFVQGLRCEVPRGSSFAGRKLEIGHREHTGAEWGKFYRSTGCFWLSLIFGRGGCTVRLCVHFTVPVPKGEPAGGGSLVDQSKPINPRLRLTGNQSHRALVADGFYRWG